MAYKVLRGSSFLKNNFMYLFFGCPGSLLLCRLFSNCGSEGFSQVAAHGRLTAVASLFQSSGSRALGLQ